MLSVGTELNGKTVQDHQHLYWPYTLGSIVQPYGTEIKDFEVSKSSKLDRAMNLNKDSRFTLRVRTPNLFKNWGYMNLRVLFFIIGDN